MPSVSSSEIEEAPEPPEVNNRPFRKLLVSLLPKVQAASSTVSVVPKPSSDSSGAVLSYVQMEHMVAGITGM